MKSYILFIAIILSLHSLLAQSKAQINSWLYDLPIRKSPETIRKVLLNNDNFQETTEDPLSYSIEFANSSYNGIILKPILPIPGRLDSSKIFLEVGTLKCKEGYSGNMKWLRFEYFSSDTLYLNKLFDTACIELKHKSKTQTTTGIRTMDNGWLGKGISFNYANNSYKLWNISATRVRYNSSKQNLTIIYSGSDN